MAKAGSFETFIENERARLTGRREEVIAKRSELDNELRSIERELDAIDAYERAKTGKGPRIAGTAGRREGGRRGEKRRRVLELIRQYPTGLSRKDILLNLGAKGDRSAEQSVSNSLAALKKAKQVSSREGKYIAQRGADGAGQRSSRGG
jgi:hypothetical protein